MTEEELEQQLVLDGKKLKKPLASVDELLSLIDRKNSLEKSASKTSTSDQSHLEETSNTKSKRKRGVVMEMAGADLGKSPIHEQPKNESNRKKKKFTWSPLDDAVMLELLVEHFIQGTGKGPDGRIRTEIYVDVVPKFNNKMGTKITRNHLEARMRTWRKQYAAFSKLRGQSGFGWDDIRKCVVVDKDVWDNFVKTNAWAEKFKNKTCLHYDQLSIICGNTIATGSFSSTGLDINDGDAQYGIETQFPEEDVELSPSDDFDQQTPTENRQRSVTPSSSRNRQRPRSHAESTQMMSASVENMATAVTNYLEAMKEMEQQKVNLIREIEQRKIDKLNEESSDGCLEALMDMPGLSEETLFAATELFENKEKRRTFLKLDPAKRVNWLYWVIGKGL